MGGLVLGLVGWLVGWLLGLWVAWLTDWVGCVINGSLCRSASLWLVGRLVGQSVDCSFVWASLPHCRSVGLSLVRWMGWLLDGFVGL
jgi:hypothetical protein